MHVYLHLLHPHTKFYEKHKFFIASVKRTKKRHEKAYFSIKF
jgi:hypothetical protein